MPIYEYRCKNCNQVFEEWLKDFDVTTMPCPHCQGEGERMLSMPSFILKGGGWYATDYGGRDRGESSSEEAPAGAASDAPFSGALEKRERPASAATASPATPTNK